MAKDKTARDEEAKEYDINEIGEGLWLVTATKHAKPDETAPGKTHIDGGISGCGSAYGGVLAQGLAEIAKNHAIVTVVPINTLAYTEGGTCTAQLIVVTQ